MEPNVFNLEKSDYEQTPLFLGEKPALNDTVNKRYPQIWNLYKKMKALDWDELEFDFSKCAVDFATCPRSVYDIMIKTIAWQWEADSVVSRNIGPIVAPFVSSSELWNLWSAITTNECLHAITYSEMVKQSFENPNEVMRDVLAVKESIARLETVTSAISHTYTVSHKLALGEIDRNSHEAYDAIFIFTVVVWFLERIQFVASFAVTFSIARTGLFGPIGAAVQKICQDEFEVHAEADYEIIRIELATERGQRALVRNKALIQKIFNEILESEKAWCDYAFSEGRELVGMNSSVLFNWTLFCAKEPAIVLGLDVGYDMPKKNPLIFMEDWMDISKIQRSPQEEKNGAYMIGQVIDNTDGMTFDFDF